jgi:hypothetical protein
MGLLKELRNMNERSSLAKNTNEGKGAYDLLFLAVTSNGRFAGRDVRSEKSPGW